eukprot:TRINITY_DN32702_c0_g1_i1.p1 TRINITY_DN32702_c0_g1~~TRINITY_DN32702_c0_g1_i1.p1  ORF type:complete len:283 (+),score=0.52 TRINITY_DN32702_c0_g1_i1:26-850(+)
MSGFAHIRPPPFDRLTATLCWHFFMAVIDLCAWSVQAAMGTPDFRFGGWSCYLTLWGQFTQGMYFLLAFAVDGLWFYSQREALVGKLLPHRDAYFTLAFPVANLIGTVFWTVLFPVTGLWKWNIPGMPGSFWLTFLQHGLTWIAVWVELFLVYHQYANKWKEMATLIAYALAYLVWNLICRFKNGRFPYYFQDLLNAWQTPLFDVLILASIIGVYWLGRWLTARWWGKEGRQVDYMGRVFERFGPEVGNVEERRSISKDSLKQAKIVPTGDFGV